MTLRWCLCSDILILWKYLNYEKLCQCVNYKHWDSSIRHKGEIREQFL